jgi:GntR family transcriptional regulator
MDKLADGDRPGGAASQPAWHNPDVPNGSQPRHHQIADALRRQIASGALEPGDQIPSEHDMMRRFGVSRGTIRQARAALRADGTIAGSQGRRLVVRGTPLTQPLGELVSFTAWVRSLGKEPGGEVISFARELASAEAATALGLSAGDLVWHLERVRSSDGTPLLIERTSFPEAIGALLADVDLEKHSVYEQLAQRGVTVSTARHLIDAIPATPADARLLDIAAGSALLRVVRQATTIDGSPVEWSDDRYRGDGVNFAIENRAGATGLVRQLSESGVGSRKSKVGDWAAGKPTANSQ